MKNLSLNLALAVVSALSVSPLFAATYPLPAPGNSIVGEIKHADVEPGENFSTIGRRYDMGYYELIEANPNVDPNNPQAWKEIVIPSRYILPQAPRKGIVVNLAELRLYYYPPGKNVVMTYPVGIGRMGWNTPMCVTTITAKTKNPTWNVPESIRADRAEDGVYLPKSVPPGPDNPLGFYSMRLAVQGGTFLIHGTNDPSGVGRRSSSGCIRMLPEDVESLFSQVGVGTQVTIVHEAVKAGWRNGELYLESHVPLQEEKHDNINYSPMMLAIKKAVEGHPANIDWTTAHEVAQGQTGIPTVIGATTTGKSNLADVNTNLQVADNTVGNDVDEGGESAASYMSDNSDSGE